MEMQGRVLGILDAAAPAGVERDRIWKFIESLDDAAAREQASTESPDLPGEDDELFTMRQELRSTEGLEQVPIAAKGLVMIIEMKGTRERKQAALALLAQAVEPKILLEAFRQALDSRDMDAEKFRARLWEWSTLLGALSDIYDKQTPFGAEALELWNDGFRQLPVEDPGDAFRSQFLRALVLLGTLLRTDQLESLVSRLIEVTSAAEPFEQFKNNAIFSGFAAREWGRGNRLDPLTRGRLLDHLLAMLDSGLEPGRINGEALERMSEGLVMLTLKFFLRPSTLLPAEAAKDREKIENLLQAPWLARAITPAENTFTSLGTSLWHIFAVDAGLTDLDEATVSVLQSFIEKSFREKRLDRWHELTAFAAATEDKEQRFRKIRNYLASVSEADKRESGTSLTGEASVPLPDDELFLGMPSELRTVLESVAGTEQPDAARTASALESLRAAGRSPGWVMDRLRSGVTRAIDESEREADQNRTQLIDGLLELPAAQRNRPLAVFGNLFDRFQLLQAPQLQTEVDRLGDRLGLILQTASGLLDLPEAEAAPAAPVFSEQDIETAENALAAVRAISQPVTLEYQLGSSWQQRPDQEALYQGLIDAASNAALVNGNLRIRLVAKTREEAKELIRRLNGISGPKAKELVRSRRLGVQTAVEASKKVGVLKAPELMIAADAEGLLRTGRTESSLDAAYFGDRQPIEQAALATPAQLLLAGVTALSEKAVRGLQRFENGLIQIENEKALTAFEYLSSRLAMEAERMAAVEAAA